MTISYSPDRIEHIEHQLPEELDHLFTCKNPHITLGAVMESFYAERTAIASENMSVASVMPYITKKYEVQRPEAGVDGSHNVDIVPTTRELVRMIKTASTDSVNLPEDGFDALLGLGTGATNIFGITGGVMEAALRTVCEVVIGRELPSDKLHVTPIVGLEQVKTTPVTVEDTPPAYEHLKGVTVNVAVASGLESASMFMDEMAAGTSPYHPMEVVGCPRNCVNGSGQPGRTEKNYREKRSSVFYSKDKHKMLRKSHESSDLMRLHSEYLDEPNGHLSHHLLHTCYVRWGRYNRPIQQANNRGEGLNFEVGA